MYIECAKRVSEKRTSDPNKDTTCILNELLADENWLNQVIIWIFVVVKLIMFVSVIFWGTYELDGDWLYRIQFKNEKFSVHAVNKTYKI